MLWPRCWYVGNSSEFPQCVPAKQLLWTIFTPLFLCCSVVFGLSPLSYLSFSFSLSRIYFLNQASWVSWALGTSLQHIRFAVFVLIPMFSLGSKRKQASKTKSTTSLPSKPLFLCYPYVTHMLVKGNFKTIIELPKYVDVNEWLAFNSKFYLYPSALLIDIVSISFRVLQLYQHVLFIHHWFLQRTKLSFNVRRSWVSCHHG